MDVSAAQSVISTGVIYSYYALAAFVELQRWYNGTSGIWDTTGWWNSANCLTTLGDLAAINPLVVPYAKEIYANTFTNAQTLQFSVVKDIEDYKPVSHYQFSWSPGCLTPPNVRPNGFLNSYYDDEGWWALAWIQAYDVTKKPEYLEEAVTIFDDMKKGNTTNCGGIWWDKENTYVNAIANELYLSVAAHLANRVSGQKETYFNEALAQWDWFCQSGMINERNLINDGLTDDCANNGGTEWSYNQGVILGALVELDAASGYDYYIDTAHSIAKAAISGLTDSDGILHDPCEPNCGADASQFKGIFMRNLQILQAASQSDDYLGFITANADSIWNQDRNDRNQLSLVWSGPFINPANASTQSSALDALVAAAAF